MKTMVFRKRVRLFVSLLLVMCVAFSSPGYNSTLKAFAIEEEINDPFSEMEAYICSLINSQSGRDFYATTDTWRQNLAYISDNEQRFKADPLVREEFIDAYISEFRYVDAINSILSSDAAILKDKEEPSRPELQSLIARNKTITYANTYWSSYNTTNYPTWTLDCANFASQCICYGGKSMVGTPSTPAVANNINNWFSYGTAQSAINVSESWRAANGFCLHWLNSSLGHVQYTPSQMASYGAAYNYGYIGDAVSLLHQDSQGNYYAYHTMIVVGKSNGNLILAAHTSNTNTTTLASKASGCAGCIIYNIFGYD